jgi:U32 family peptidase
MQALNKMEILSPINSVNEVGPLHEAGATELYCGIMRREVQQEYTNVFSLNSRQVSEANLPGFGELAEVVGAARARGMKVFVAYNALYSDDQFEALTGELEDALACGPDGLIVADIALMMYMKERYPGVKVVVSTFGGSFNSRTASLYRELGASRITLPRHLTVGEISAIAAACPDIEYEVFIMSERCYFPNALCRFEHAAYRVKEGPFSFISSVSQKLLGRRMAMFTATYRNQTINRLQDRFVANNGMMCCREYEADLFDAAGAVVEAGKTFRFFDMWNSFREACGLCALYDIASVPAVKSVKVVGRQSLTGRKVADTRMVRDALDLLKGNPTRGEFCEAAKKMRKDFYPDYCGDAFCYYSEPDVKK